MRTKQLPKLTFLFVASILLLGIACKNDANTKKRIPSSKDLSKENLIPKPVQLTATGSSFELTKQTKIYFPENNAAVESVANDLVDLINPATGFQLKPTPTASTPSDESIYLSLTKGNTTIGEEGYQLTVTETSIHLEANTPAGLFIGIQTLRQLLPATIEKTSKQNGPWEIASGTIVDYPAYGYRGAMLDVSRHFFPPSVVKRLIDYLAMYKINTLHLHLADDQGWRIEIKSWPNLTTHGGSTQVGGGKGGFYTQEEYTDIVKYAQDRFITIVPEIDMPGHTNAALSSYPELNCDGKAPKLYTGTEVGFSTLCTSKEITYKFIDDVIRELAAMTPGKYIHIGGDESHVTDLKDYIPFIERVQKIVKKHGKEVIGWDEIAHAKLLPNSVVQYWAKAENAIMGIKQGAKVLMSPAKKAYLDMQYDSTTHLGLHWAAYIEVDSAYMWDLATYEAGINKENIIGIEGPLWSETITNIDELEYMVFPRLLGLAEIGWTPTKDRIWDEYKMRLAAQKERFKILGIDYYASKKIPWKPEPKVVPN